MAVNVLYREYETVTTGAAAFIEDVGNMFDWDSKPNSGEYSGAFFKGDVDNSKYCGFALMPSSTYPVGQLLLQQGVSVQQSLPIAQHNGTSYAQHVNIAAWENGISICFPDVTNIWTDSLGDNRVAVTVGVCKSTNATTGESGWCAFMVSFTDTYYTYILGQSTSETTSYDKHWDTISALPYSILIPPYTAFSADIPDDILIPKFFPSTGIPAMYGYCNFGGRRYYKNGHIFIPA